MRYNFYDITLYRRSGNNDDGIFTTQNNLISDLYIDFFDGYKPPGTTRICVDIGNEDYIRGYHGSILGAEVAFDENDYQTSSVHQQHQIILDTIHSIAIFCADKYGWDKTVLNNAYKKVIKCGFIYKKELKKRLSKDRKHYAALLLENDGKSTIISVIFYNLKGELLNTVELLQSFRHHNLITHHNWLNNQEFGLQLKNKQLVIKASLNKNDAETEIKPAMHTIEELEGYLRLITYRKLTDRGDYVSWANQ